MRLLLIGAALAAIACREPHPATRGGQSAKENVYLASVVLSDPRLSAAQNFLGDTVTYLDAQVTNRGDRLVRGLEVAVEFQDALHQVVLRERSSPVSVRTQPLKPGETRSFRLTFEHLPADWNGALPAMKVTRVEL